MATGSTFKECKVCIKCKNRAPQNPYAALCIVCMSHVAHDIEAQIRLDGPITGGDDGVCTDTPEPAHIRQTSKCDV